MQLAKDFDFIVVGSGIAGLNSAITLSTFGTVLLVTKRKIKDSSTYYAQGGIAAVTKNEDSFRSHLQDTVTAGYNHNNKKAVKRMVENGQAAVEKLIQLGVPFDKKINGDLISSFEAAHSYPRIVHATDFTGREIENVLVSHAITNKNIIIWEYATALTILTKNNACVGIQILKGDKLFTYYPRAVILATGGVGQLYAVTTNPSIATGDGIAIAYRAGAVTKDMEFVQFHPTALLENSFPVLLLSEALRGEGAVLVTKSGERFMQKIHPQAELAPRDVVTRAIFQEQKKGTVYLDIRFKGKNFIYKRFPNITRELKKRGFDLATQPIPITPAEHFLCGGIKTDLYGRTSIKNLFAYGECAATGAHGANRLASNSLLEGMVFSEQIRFCVQDLPDKKIGIKQSIKSLKNRKKRSKVDLYAQETVSVPSQIRMVMWRHAGIIRTVSGLTQARKQLEALQKELKSQINSGASFFETENMLTVALLIVKAAQKRKKSIGTHFING